MKFSWVSTVFHVLFILFQFNIHFETTNISISLKLEALQHAPSTLEKRKINGIMETNVCGMLTIINEREPSRKFWKEGKSIIYISRICKRVSPRLRRALSHAILCVIMDRRPTRQPHSNFKIKLTIGLRLVETGLGRLLASVIRSRSLHYFLCWLTVTLCHLLRKQPHRCLCVPWMDHTQSYCLFNKEKARKRKTQ